MMFKEIDDIAVTTHIFITTPESNDRSNVFFETEHIFHYDNDVSSISNSDLLNVPVRRGDLSVLVHLSLYHRHDIQYPLF